MKMSLLVSDRVASYELVAQVRRRTCSSQEYRCASRKVERSTNNLAKIELTFDIVIPRSRLKSIRGQGPDFELQVNKEVTST